MARCIFFQICLHIIFQPTFAQTPRIQDTVFYQLHPAVKKDRVELHVELKYRCDTVHLINLLQDNFGTPDLPQYIISFKGESGTTVEDVSAVSKRIIPTDGGKVNLKYIISYDPSKLEVFSYAPSVSSGHFHVAGCQWMLPLGDLNQVNTYVFELTRPAKGWHYYSSLSPTFKRFAVQSSFEELSSSTAFGGNKVGYGKFTAFHPVEVFIAPGLNWPMKTIFQDAEQIVKLMRNKFSDSSEKYYQIAIMPREGILSGHSIDRQFRCFVRPDATKEQLLLLMAHELFHGWLPNKIDIQVPKGEYGFKHEWFSEGFTEYLSWKVLKQAGIISNDRFIELINDAIRSFDNNPYAILDYEQLKAVARKGGGSAFKKLSYYKGALLAARWDNEIQNQTSSNSSLDDLVTDLYREVSKSNGRIAEAAFFIFVERYGINARKDFDNFILKGNRVELPLRFGDYKLTSVEEPVFYLGFDLDAMFSVREMPAIDSMSKAYKAGLREGMQFIEISNSRRFINGWSKDRPVTVTIQSEGKKQTISFWPYGANRIIQLYKKI